MQRWALVWIRLETGTRSLFDEVMKSAIEWAGDPRRVIPIALEQERPWWNHWTVAIPESQWVEEPLDRGSAVSLAVALSRMVRMGESGMSLLSWTQDAPETVFERSEQVAVFDARRHGPWIQGPLGALAHAVNSAQPHLYDRVIANPWDLEALLPFLPSLDWDRDVFDRTDLPAEPVETLPPPLRLSRPHSFTMRDRSTIALAALRVSMSRGA
jgi:hypothetical protein